MSCSVISACAASATARAFSSSESRRGDNNNNSAGPASSASSSSRGSVRCSSSSSSAAVLSSRVSLAARGGAGLSITAAARASPSRRGRSLTIVANLGGQYGDTFADVDRVLVSYFTFRALKETLAQIQETDLSPGKTDYKWLYKFASENNPNDSQAFIKALFAERQDYGQRILAQRQSLFDSWQRTFVSDSAAKIIEDQNLEHLRDHLFSTVNLNEECLAFDHPSECTKEKEALALEEEDETIA